MYIYSHSNKYINIYVYIYRYLFKYIILNSLLSISIFGILLCMSNSNKHDPRRFTFIYLVIFAALKNGNHICKIIETSIKINRFREINNLKEGGSKGGG